MRVNNSNKYRQTYFPATSTEAVSSALSSFTIEFGMGSGVSMMLSIAVLTRITFSKFEK